MLQDTFFSFSRFKMLCRKEMTEHSKFILLGMVFLYGTLVLLILTEEYTNYKYIDYYKTRTNSFMQMIFFWYLWVFGCLSASLTMANLKSKASRISTLMLPATPFEKFFSRWLISTVGFLILLLVSFKLADYTRVLVYSLAYPEIDTVVFKLSQLGANHTYWNVSDNNLQFGMYVTGYWFTQSLFVLGSCVWPKNSFLKTFMALAAIVVTYSLTAYFFTELCPLRQYDFFPERITSEQIYLILISVGSFFTLVNWTLAYYRFKESEVIHRM